MLQRVLFLFTVILLVDSSWTAFNLEKEKMIIWHFGPYTICPFKKQLVNASEAFALDLQSQSETAWVPWHISAFTYGLVDCCLFKSRSRALWVWGLFWSLRRDIGSLAGCRIAKDFIFWVGNNPQLYGSFSQVPWTFRCDTCHRSVRLQAMLMSVEMF